MRDRITPPFNEDSAHQLVQNAEDAWNRRVTEEIPDDYSEDTRWRYKDHFFEGREHIVPFLSQRWPIQQDYRLKKEMWAFADNRISVRFISEWRHRDTGQWYRTYGNEHWQYDDDGQMTIQDISANDVSIDKSERTLTD